MKKKKVFLLLASLCAAVQGVWAWDGSGTVTDPYQIQTSDDWKRLDSDVVGGNTFSGQFFTMTADIDAQGISIGSIGARFMGTFDGAGHTLAYNRGSEDNYVDDYCSPFVFTEAATIRHLNVTGRVYTSRKYAAGIVSSIENTAGPTIIDDCHVSTHMRGAPNLDGDASMGGLIGLVQDVGPHTNGPVISNCSFTGSFGMQGGLGGLVSYTNMPVTFEHCMYDGAPAGQGNMLATYVRTPENMICPMTECYCTGFMGVPQGVCVFSEVDMRGSGTYEIVSEPTLTFNGKKYYTAGTQVLLTVPEGTAFDHWVTSGSTVGCFISDPWTAGGIHTLTDVRSQPVLSIATSMPEPYQKNRSRHGIIYRYLSNRDYLLFMSDSLRQARGYQFDSDGECFVYDAEGTKTYITVVWGCDPSDGTFQNYYREGWFFQSKNYEGCLIDNDLVATAWDHTHLFAIAPRVPSRT